MGPQLRKKPGPVVAKKKPQGERESAGNVFAARAAAMHGPRGTRMFCAAQRRRCRRRRLLTATSSPYCSHCSRQEARGLSQRQWLGQ